MNETLSTVISLALGFALALLLINALFLVYAAVRLAWYHYRLNQLRRAGYMLFMRQPPLFEVLLRFRTWDIYRLVDFPPHYVEFGRRCGKSAAAERWRNGR